MGMYFLEIVPVQNLDSTFAYGISVMASSDGSITSNEVFQFTLNDIFTNVTLDAPEKTKTNYENNIVTWEVGTLDTLSKDTPLVLNVNVEHPTELQEGTLIASEITNTFLNEQGEEMIENYDDFNFNPQPHRPEFKLEIDVTRLDNENCQYRLDFKVTNTSNVTINDIVLNYLLDLENFIWVTPPASVTQWNVGTLTTSGPGKSKYQSADIQFIGATTGSKTIFASITASPPNTQAFTGIRELLKDVRETCVKPCCEDCPVHEDASFDECQQTKNVTIEPELSSDGREIKVKVKVNNVCKGKTVVVGLELFQKVSGQPVRKALKVIQLTRPNTGDDCATLECDCATFFIPEPLCPEKDFSIKAQAHYYDIGGSGCNCTDCPNPPPHGILE